MSNDLGVHHYVYDHKGERVIKSSVMHSSVQINDQNIDDIEYLEPYTLYINPYYVVTELKGGDKVSKHYYMNTQRVATDISINYQVHEPMAGPQQPNARDPKKPSEDTTSVNYNAAFADLQTTLTALGHQKLDVDGLGDQPTLEEYYPELVSKPSQNSTMAAKNAPESTTRVMFWYHPDYLGNVDLVTERDGKTYEFFTYNPWGEEMHQYNANTFGFASLYRFNAKEEDGETGLHYYGARYYQSKLSLWLSVDAMSFKGPAITPYAFSHNNAVMLVDPDGNYPVYIITRSYAPFATFGPGNKWYGDDRGHTLDRGASYRSLVSIMHDTETKETTAIGGHSRSHTTDGKKDAVSPTYVENRSEGSNIDVHSSGSNKAQRGARPIDQFTKLNMDVQGDVKGDHVLNITGTISGDDFPNQESIIYDSNGTGVWLGNFETSGDQEYGPVTDLPFENEGDVNIKVNVSIMVNKNGDFQGIKLGDKELTIDEWNAKFE